MRSDQAMLDLILNYANQDDNVRTVVMNGSRVNPNIEKDLFQDFDIVYLVRDVEPLRQNADLVSYFGEIMILQTPEDMVSPSPVKRDQYVYLMQFLDGNRIDLSIIHVTSAKERLADSLSVVLLDKDGSVPTLPPPSDRDYLPKKPSAKAFADCCNEFWWVNPYVAKGLWRDELTYATHIMNAILRKEMMQMLTWYFGVGADFQNSLGTHGKYIKHGIDPELWVLVEQTYADAHTDHIWDALFVSTLAIFDEEKLGRQRQNL